MKQITNWTLIFTVAVCFVLLLGGTGGVAAQETANITVATDGSGDYTSIQNAVDNAREGDSIKVEPGTYEQRAEISKNITLFAPNGATIANTSAVASKYNSIEARSGLQIDGDTNPTISGFTLTDWQWGISAGSSEGDWVVKDTTISGGTCGVCAAGTPGDWTVTNVTVTNGGTISGSQSSGDWTIEDSTIRTTDVSASESTGDITITNTDFQNVNSDAVNIEDSTGSLTVSDSHLESVTYAAIEAENTSADIVISTTAISGADTGIDFEEHSTSDLTVTTTTLSDITYDAIDVQNAAGAITVEDAIVETADNGIDAEKTSGQLTVTNFTVSDTDGDGIDASNATGDSTVRDSTFENMGDKSIDLIDTEGKWNIHESILTGGSDGALDTWDAAVTPNASYNYWGATDGPSGQFTGSGGAVGGNAVVTPYYTDSSLTTLSSEIGNETGKTYADGPINITLDPSTVTANTTVNHNLSYTVIQASNDGGSDTYTITLPSSASFDNAGNSLTVTDANGDEISISSSASLQDANGGTDNQITFGIQPDSNFDTSSVTIDANVTVNFPPVEETTEAPVTLAVSDSTQGDTSAQTNVTIQVAGDRPADLPESVPTESFTAVDGDGDGDLTPLELVNAINEDAEQGSVNGVEVSPLEFVDMINWNANQ